MNLNLLIDPWIPVVMRDGARRRLAPWQVADAEVLRPDWPRADLDLACHELLIGLVHLADPPEDDEDWEDRRVPDPDRLRERLAPLASAFELLGDKERFLQEMGGLEGEAIPVDALFIDSAGDNTARNNADLMVRRGRYGALDLPLAAMALYAFQQHAPSGGAGNRTSMRGGGPMVTLVDPGRGLPGRGLWDLVWSNVPYGAPQGITALPWMRPTRVSQAKGTETYPTAVNGVPAEAFFGMPRRLRLVSEGERVTGVVQKPWGTNYLGWEHPLSPYYRMKPGGELLPRHPKPGRFGYRQWLGVIARAESEELAQQALCLRNWRGRVRDEPARTIIGGWAMDNMKPRDFVWSVEPLLRLEPLAEERLRGLVLAADQARIALRAALTPVLYEGSAREAVLEELYLATEDAFLRLAETLAAPEPDLQAVAVRWRDTLRSEALALFDDRAIPGLEAREAKTRAIVEARSRLLGALSGRGKVGEALFAALGLEVPKAEPKGRQPA